MSNVYYHPTEIYGSPRRAIVERVEACRPRDGSYSLRDYTHAGFAMFRWQRPASDVPSGFIGVETALRLTRLAVIEFLQGPRENHDIGLDCSITGALCYGATDKEYNSIAHRLADALNIAH